MSSTFSVEILNVGIRELRLQVLSKIHFFTNYINQFV